MLPDLKSLLPTTTTPAAPNSGTAPANAPGAQAFANSLNSPAIDDASDAGNANTATAVQTLPQTAGQTTTDYDTPAADAATTNISAELASLSETTTAKFFASTSGKLVRFDNSHQADTASSLSAFAEQASASAAGQQLPLVLDSLRDAAETVPQSAATFLTAVSTNIPLQLPSLNESTVEDTQRATVVVDSSAQTEATSQVVPTAPTANAPADLRLSTFDVAQAVLPSLQDLPAALTDAYATPSTAANDAQVLTANVATAELLPDVAALSDDVALQGTTESSGGATTKASSAPAQPTQSLPTVAGALATDDLQNKPTTPVTGTDSATSNIAPTSALPAAKAKTQTAAVTTPADQEADTQANATTVDESTASAGSEVNSTVAANSGEDSVTPAAKVLAQPRHLTAKASAEPEVDAKDQPQQSVSGNHPFVKSKLGAQPVPVSSTQPSAKQPLVSQTAPVTQQAAAIAQATVAPATQNQADDASSPDAEPDDRLGDQLLGDGSARTLTPPVHAAPQVAALQASDRASTPSKSQSQTIAAIGSKSVDATKSDAASRTIEPIADAVTTNFVSSPAGNSTTANTTQFRTEARESHPTQLGHQVLTAIQKAADEGSHLRMQLTPPSLGSLIVDVSRTENGIVARLEFSNPAAQQVALQNLPDLQQTLAQQGIKVDRIEIQSQDANQQPGRGRDEQARDGAQQRQDRRQEQSRQQSQQTEEEADENLAA